MIVNDGGHLSDSQRMLSHMVTTDEFTVTEDAFRAVIETCHTLSQAVTELSRQVEAANEALVIMQYRMDDIEQTPAHAGN